MRGFRKVLMTICIGSIIFQMCSCSSNNQNGNTLPNEPQEQLVTDSKEQPKPTNRKQPDKSPMEDKLIGVWHASPSVAAGYSNVFFFHKDNKFSLYYSQYDEEKRTLDISGNWSVVDDKLVLSITQKTIVVGGELEESSPSSTSKYSIVNGTIQKKKLDPPEKVEYSLKEVKEEADSLYESKLLINKESYWKISGDPDDKYLNEQFVDDEDTSSEAKQDTNPKTDDLKQIDKFEVYTNGRYGFSIKYPKSWAISEESPSGDGVVLYDKEENDIRVYGGYLLGDNIDRSEVDEAKKKGKKVEDFVTDNGEKGYKILENSGNRAILNVVVYGNEKHCHLYADTTTAFFKENELMLIDLAKSMGLSE